MKAAFLFVGASKEPWLQEFLSAYEAKIAAFCKTEFIYIKPNKAGRELASAKKEAEGEAILKALKPDDRVVLCDERGALVDSIQASKKIMHLFAGARGRLVFIIAGPFGATDAVKARADWSWSFSPMVFNHHVAQAVLLEQVYRSLTIWKGLPYHNE